MSFEYILKLAESNGIAINEKMAKLIVKKYGRKDHLSLEDCLFVNKRRASHSVSKSPKK